MKTVVVFPLINNTDRSVIKSDYFSPELFFSVDRFGTKSFNSNILSDFGYVLVYANRIHEAPIAREDLAQLRQSKIPDHLRSLVFDYAVITSFDEFKPIGLYSMRMLKITLLVYDVKMKKLICDIPYEHTKWRGILGGPLNAITGENETDMQSILSAEIGEALNEQLFMCPIFGEKKQ